MRYFVALAVWLLPAVLFCTTPGEYERAATLVRRSLGQLRPQGDAVFRFTQTTKMLGHLSRPWQTWERSTAGTFLLANNGSAFYRTDSTTSGRTSYSSFTYCCDTTLAIVHYGESKPLKLTLADKRDFVYDLSAYSPIFLLNDFLAQNPEGSFLRYASGPADSVVYAKSDGNIISLAIDPGTLQVGSVSVTYPHDLYGDVVKTITFQDYTGAEGPGFSYPTRITVSELGFDASVVSVSSGAGAFNRNRVLDLIPAGYALEPEAPEQEPQIAVTRYNPNIHFIDLKDAHNRTMVVEFKDYLLVAEAPLTTGNGETIIARAREIAPGKPVRYFVFGHHHPHYLGGLRAFVHDGATVLSTRMDSAYVTQLASFKRTIRPDILAREPRPLRLELFDQGKTISDGDLEMRIIHIGQMSQHTDDYLIYYFPKYKLLFQDDLTGIKEDGTVEAASPRQKGLYDAIVAHDLDVDTIIQGWPLGRYGLKSIMGFDELRRSVEQAATKK